MYSQTALTNLKHQQSATFKINEEETWSTELNYAETSATTGQGKNGQQADSS